MTMTMKQFIALLAISTVLWSCGGGGGDDPPPPATNNAPSTPSLVDPTNNKLCIDNSVVFQWNAATDPEGDAITYQIQVSKNNQFTQIVQTLSGSETTRSISLEKGIAYYWRVKATDTKNASSSYSSSFQFYTEGEGVTNHLPFSPELVNPVLNAVEQEATTTLEWTASDVDNDPLTFDVFFGTDPDSVKFINRVDIDGDGIPETIDDEDLLELPIEQDQTDPNKIIYSIVDITINSSTRYYWMVVVKDNKDDEILGETIGQIWNFQTD